LLSDLTTLFTGRNLIKLAITDSTNRYLSNLLDEEKPGDGTAVLADCQSAGEGMASNHWHSEYGKNLLLSILFLPHFLDTKKIFLFNKAIAVAARNFIAQIVDQITYKRRVCIKWPNDIYVNNEKICGIKIEITIRGSQLQNVIVGIGLNINQTQFPDDLPNPVSLKLISGKNYSVDDCFHFLCNELEKQYLTLKAGHYEKINRQYLQYLYRLNKPGEFEDTTGIFNGVIKDVDENGRLCIETPDGNISKYEMKDVRYVL
jgi:BirA family transcriptional regulator, biotin operon repressor / biotin---[acetyl-CoA-carboxylase] ligase